MPALPRPVSSFVIRTSASISLALERGASGGRRRCPDPMLRISPPAPSAEFLRFPNGVNPRTRQNLKNPEKFCAQSPSNDRGRHAKVFGIVQILPGVDAIGKSDTMSRWSGRGECIGALKVRQLRGFIDCAHELCLFLILRKTAGKILQNSKWISKSSRPVRTSRGPENFITS